MKKSPSPSDVEEKDTFNFQVKNDGEEYSPPPSKTDIKSLLKRNQSPKKSLNFAELTDESLNRLAKDSSVTFKETSESKVFLEEGSEAEDQELHENHSGSQD
eukprot:Sdes_comp15703_c0_seq1m4737